MHPRAIVTTSWDDGHPLDLRLADLLEKYGLKGTFYIPIEGQRAVLDAKGIREIGTQFEIGAHTFHHTPLTEVSREKAWEEIECSKQAIEDITGGPCRSFCFPKGKFQRKHLPLLRDAGFSIARTVEILSLNFPVLQSGVLVMPTTVQVFSHSTLGMVRNAAKRLAGINLYGWMRHVRRMDWTAMAEAFLRLAIERGGVFHLWGHSWEIEEHGQWKRLESVFQLLSQHRGQIDFMTNLQVPQSQP